MNMAVTIDIPAIVLGATLPIEENQFESKCSTKLR